MHAATRRPRSLAVAVVGALLGSGLVLSAGPASAAVPVPPTPANLPSSIEAAQPYVGQSTCDPVAKPGVAAFRDLVLRTYPTTSSLGIVRDCGAGGQSEHKEGRAWDWGVSAADSADVARVNALLGWMLATDTHGNPRAIARRLGLMYVIWNQRILGMYDTQGWHAYTGADPHTGHVHFSFGWNGARKTTSYWDGSVAPVDYGPAGAPASGGASAPPPVAPVVPVPDPAHLAVLRTYGGQTLQQGSTGTAVKVLQTALHISADGDYGNQSAQAVSSFESSQKLPVDGVFGTSEWPVLFPPPVDPFGSFEGLRRTPGGVALWGWALDADTAASLSVSLVLDGTAPVTLTAANTRNDVATRYPGLGTAHGFSRTLALADGSHTACLTAVDAPGTPGRDGTLGCKTVVVSHSPAGVLETVTTQLGRTTANGWALDADTADPLAVALSVDGKALPAQSADVSRPDVAALWPGYGDRHGLATRLSLVEGTHRLCLTGRNAATAADPRGVDRVLGCLSTTVRHRPVGLLDVARQEPRGVRVRGWALDPDGTGPLSTVLTVDGTKRPAATASLTRTDLPTAWSANGTAHGLDVVLPLPAGTHSVCLTATNLTGTPGAAVGLGCRSVTVRHAPVGVATWARPVPGVGVSLSGWALDPDTTAATSVALSVDGVRVPDLHAGSTSAAAAAAWPGYGTGHGWSTTLRLAAGRHRVCVALADAVGTPGTSTALGCRSVLIVVRRPGNLATARTYGRTTLARGSSGAAVTALQTGLRLPADGSFGSGTAAAVRAFQLDQHLPVDGVFRPAAWALLLPRPVVPFGVLDVPTRVPGGVAITGWTADTDIAGAIAARVTADGGAARTVPAGAYRTGLSRSWPEVGSYHAFRVVLPLAAGPHTVCVTGVNASGTPGPDGPLGCRTTTVSSAPLGVLYPPTASVGAVTLTGWALDPDTAAAITVQALLDGVASRSVLAAATKAGVDAGHPGYGDAHGYTLTVPATAGAHQLCVQALNATGTPGGSTQLRCASVTVS